MTKEDNNQASVNTGETDELDFENVTMRRILWSVIVSMLIICFLNTIVLFWIFKSIKMDTIKINDSSFKIFGTGIFDIVHDDNGLIESYDNESILIDGKRSFAMQVVKNDDDNVASEMKITPEKISFNGLRIFDVVIGNKRLNFMKSFVNLRLPEDLETLEVTELLRTSKIVSPVGNSLTLKSDKFLRLRGNKGVRVKGKLIDVLADGDIYIHTEDDGDIYFLSGNFSMNITRLPIVPITSRPSLLPKLQYKLCACMPVGNLFIVPVVSNTKSQLACSYVDMSPERHPCMVTPPKQLFYD